MRVKDLPPARSHKSVTDVHGIVSKIWVRQPVMYCRACSSEYSANPVDYLASMSAETLLRCCGIHMVLVDKRIVYEEVQLKAAEISALSGVNDVC